MERIHLRELTEITCGEGCIAERWGRRAVSFCSVYFWHLYIVG